jgi:hypothetical protein
MGWFDDLKKGAREYGIGADLPATEPITKGLSKAKGYMSSLATSGLNAADNYLKSKGGVGLTEHPFTPGEHQGILASFDPVASKSPDPLGTKWNLIEAARTKKSAESAKANPVGLNKLVAATSTQPEKDKTAASRYAEVQDYLNLWGGNKIKNIPVLQDIAQTVTPSLAGLYTAQYEARKLNPWQKHDEDTSPVNFGNIMTAGNAAYDYFKH